MNEFDDSDLLPLKDYQRMREQLAQAADGPLGRATVLPPTLLAELRNFRQQHAGAELIDVLAACRRHVEPALICLGHAGLVWPVTVFPSEMTYHSPRDMLACADSTLAQFKVISVEPASVRPPGHWMHERIADHSQYRPLLPMLWSLALRGPSRHALVSEISGSAAYRVARSLKSVGLSASGALGPAAERLHRESASLRALSEWPGMDLERGIRLLNALHLISNLIVSRTHPAARPEPRSTLARSR